MMVSCQGSISPAQSPNHALISMFSFAEPLLRKLADYLPDFGTLQAGDA
jgi:hypothetical protein